MPIARRLHSSLYKPAFAEVSNRVPRGLYVWRRTKSSTASDSVPSDALPEQGRKGRKRLKKEERKALVQSFVHKYREANSGKFPSATDTRKELGGSHYVIREILQEMQYKESMMNIRDETLLKKEVREENRFSIDSQEVLGIQLTVDAEVKESTQIESIDDVRLGSPGCEQFEEKEEPQTSLFVKNTFSTEAALPTTAAKNAQDVATQSDHMYFETKEVSHDCSQKPEGYIEEASSIEMLNHDLLKPKAEQPQQLNIDDLASNSENHQQSPNFEKSAKDSLQKQTGDEEPQKEWSMWRSLTDSIINFWRKL